MHRCFAGVVDNEVEDGGGDDAAARRSNGDDRGARGFEIANNEFFLSSRPVRKKKTTSNPSAAQVPTLM
ncbi:hypothetical protein RA11412_0418 [Rothia aeria]|uniref:Uncharacterized protein n=1 Tax=Rothia aeria TaxID=172042 RepID=A0A2Z5QWC7_9MICC|nr:hypothetical protein RA11412_0418 [Rothia aeria]